MTKKTIRFELSKNIFRQKWQVKSGDLSEEKKITSSTNIPLFRMKLGTIKMKKKS